MNHKTSAIAAAILLAATLLTTSGAVATNQAGGQIADGGAKGIKL